MSEWIGDKKSVSKFQVKKKNGKENWKVNYERRQNLSILVGWLVGWVFMALSILNERHYKNISNQNLF